MFLLYATGVGHEVRGYFQERLTELTLRFAELSVEFRLSHEHRLQECDRLFEGAVVMVNQIATSYDMTLYTRGVFEAPLLTLDFCQHQEEAYVGFHQRYALSTMQWQHLKQYLEHIEVPNVLLKEVIDEAIEEEALPPLVKIIEACQIREWGAHRYLLKSEIHMMKSACMVVVLDTMVEHITPEDYALVRQAAGAEALKKQKVDRSFLDEIAESDDALLSQIDDSLAFFVRMKTRIQNEDAQALQERRDHLCATYQQEYGDVPSILSNAPHLIGVLDNIVTFLTTKKEELKSLVQQAESHLLN